MEQNGENTARKRKNTEKVAKNVGSSKRVGKEKPIPPPVPSKSNSPAAVAMKKRRYVRKNQLVSTTANEGEDGGSSQTSNVAEAADWNRGRKSSISAEEWAYLDQVTKEREARRRARAIMKDLPSFDRMVSVAKIVDDETKQKIQAKMKNPTARQKTWIEGCMKAGLDAGSAHCFVDIFERRMNDGHSYEEALAIVEKGLKDGAHERRAFRAATIAEAQCNGDDNEAKGDDDADDNGKVSAKNAQEDGAGDTKGSEANQKLEEVGAQAKDDALKESVLSPTATTTSAPQPKRQKRHGEPTQPDENRRASSHRELLVEAMRTKVDWVPDGRLDEFEEDFARFFKKYI